MLINEDENLQRAKMRVVQMLSGNKNFMGVYTDGVHVVVRYFDQSPDLPPTVDGIPIRYEMVPGLIKAWVTSI